MRLKLYNEYSAKDVVETVLLPFFYPYLFAFMVLGWLFTIGLMWTDLVHEEKMQEKNK